MVTIGGIMTDKQIKEAIKKRMKIFNISFEEAVEEIRQIFPQYGDILDEALNEHTAKN